MKTKTAYNAVPFTYQLGTGGRVARWHTRYEGNVLQFWAAIEAPSPHPTDNWIEFYIGSSRLVDFYGVCQPSGAVFVGRAEDTTESVRFSFGPGATDLRAGWNIFAGTGF